MDRSKNCDDVDDLSEIIDSYFLFTSQNRIQYRDNLKVFIDIIIEDKCNLQDVDTTCVIK